MYMYGLNVRLHCLLPCSFDGRARDRLRFRLQAEEETFFQRDASAWQKSLNESKNSYGVHRSVKATSWRRPTPSAPAFGRTRSRPCMG